MKTDTPQNFEEFQAEVLRVFPRAVVTKPDPSVFDSGRYWDAKIGHLTVECTKRAGWRIWPGYTEYTLEGAVKSAKMQAQIQVDAGNIILHALDAHQETPEAK